MKKRVFIAGAGEFGRELFGWITTEPAGSPFEILGFVDDQEVDLTPFHIDRPVCRIDEWQSRYPDASFLAAALTPSVRRAVVAKLLQAGAPPAGYVHSSTLIGHGVEIGEGTILLPRVIVSPFASVGRFAVVNAASTIGHDTVIGDYVTLLGSNTVNGRVTVGSDAILGSRSVIHPRTKIEERATVGIGSVVVGPVAAGTTVFGNPARKLAEEPRATSRAT